MFYDLIIKVADYFITLMAWHKQYTIVTKQCYICICILYVLSKLLQTDISSVEFAEVPLVQYNKIVKTHFSFQMLKFSESKMSLPPRPCISAGLKVSKKYRKQSLRKKMWKKECKNLKAIVPTVANKKVSEVSSHNIWLKCILKMHDCAYYMLKIEMCNNYTVIFIANIFHQSYSNV